MFAKNLGDGSRVQLRLHEEATARQYRELGLFVRDCIDRVERALDRADRWTIEIVPDRVCFSCDVTVEFGETVLTANGNGFDGAVAGWEAFRQIEDQLRTQIATDATRRVA